MPQFWTTFYVSASAPSRRVESWQSNIQPGKRQAWPVNFRLNNLNMGYTLEVQGSPMFTWNSDSFTILGM